MIVIGLIAFAWWWCEFEPLHYVIDGIFGYFKPSFYLNWVQGGLSCIKCVAFWSSLAYTYDIFLACLISLLSYTLNICLRKMK